MLRNIPKILPPELVKTMMEMGHSDVLILADANFPGTAHAKKMIRMDGIMIPELLEAILQLFPLDNFIDNPVRLMRNRAGSGDLGNIQRTFKQIRQR